ncbi:NAD(P)H nitroreductase [Pseudonocardia sp. KRD-184]|uniref:NAD(P)H nitroreductase n=1 Tax=Pseudonocardia oceani TaxID=2792013 RepID=A0ABS6UHH8_9PSEU|nr:NAD(P)H nitroreductase [Pseudonocardia oceani]MBW0092818.1 NAD(P)H nitroreductase [Pseudonocardia oceani]MBW0096032.1 NAD(P)H nitroreductase [Pseudonocardia oceani]MBW0111839.1 NAD(P)H nitroreductase [Pseudonocardia oceani]MBW0122943.1 NAD(P)H nitroreductase [Pseudonocardia oceani]MBW0131694.1 NAD(P)H nitroreductase [Pseudonocardia oceani]
MPPFLAAAVEQALRAPSVHNTQPWRWRVGADSVELHADPDRHLPVTDPDRRDLLLSCGAVLHHLTVALAGAGAAAVVERLPDPEDSTHLATVSVGRGPATGAELFPAIAQRRTERRQMSHRPVPEEILADLAAHAARAGAVLLPVTGPEARARLAEVFRQAGQLQRSAPGYPAELRLWTHRLPGAHDGVPAAAIAQVRTHTDGAPMLRAFPDGRLRQGAQQTGHGRPDDAAEYLVVATTGDTVLDRLRAGEATSAVLLAATLAGLATTPLSQATEVPAVRQALGSSVLRVPEQPQLVLRVGWPATHADPLPFTPRRPLPTVLLA